MKRLITRIVAGAGFVAGCCLMQGCISKQKSVEEEPLEIIEEDPIEVVEVQEVTPIAPVATTTAYTIQKGDTISAIAVRYGLRWQDVVAVNPGISPNKLKIGQVIQLPGEVDLSKPVAPRTPPKTTTAPSHGETVYVVKSGDSLSEIALKHGVKVDDIRKANDLKDANKIAVGQKLRIPGAKKSEAKVESKSNVTAPKGDAPKSAETKVAPAPVAPPPVVKEVEAVKEKVDADLTAVQDTVKEAETTVQKYTVKAGEDLYAVAIRWGVSPSDLKAQNKLTSSDLKEGMVLEIPSGAQ